MKQILITGASGFIGSFFVETALQKGWTVWAGIRSTSSREFLTDPALHFIDLNYTDSEKLHAQIENHVAQNGKWDYIIHNAGITKSAKDTDFDRINFGHTKNLIDALRNSGNIPEKFVFMSSLSAFGPGDEKRYTPLRADDTPRPNTAYGRSKMQAEHYLRSQIHFPYIILRPTGVYGPREKDYYTMVRMINSGLDVAVGFKKQLLSFIYIKDLAKVCFDAIESPLQNKAWFVTDGDVCTSREYTEIVKDALQKDRVFKITIPLWIVRIVSVFAGIFGKITGKPTLLNPDKFRILKQRNWICDITPLEKDLSFKAKYNLREGMEETIAWYRENGWL
jgi:Nucleoside-diphosphate-sugar epimerases